MWDLFLRIWPVFTKINLVKLFQRIEFAKTNPAPTKYFKVKDWQKQNSQKIFINNLFSHLFDSYNDNPTTILYLESIFFIPHPLTLPRFWKCCFRTRDTVSHF